MPSPSFLPEVIKLLVEFDWRFLLALQGLLLVKIKTPLVLDQQTSGVSYFISILKRMVEQDAQFIIATHSPIIMAFPNATILSFDSARIRQVKYDDLEHVTLTKAFLNNPEVYLRRL